MNKKAKKISEIDLLKLLILRDIILSILVNRVVSSFKSKSQTLILSIFSTYFFVRLGMIDKISTFVISGKVIGTDYIVNLSDVVVASSAVLLIIVSRLISKSLRAGRKSQEQKKRIELRAEKRYPFELKVNIA
ncbi:MAG: hypothetical protein WAQ57_01570 [Candidatus Saccharimonadales bacterium]|jgi:hypothetical protein|nr:hypothetical protein [Candidatus Saccharibacteria bacterium]